MALLNAHRAGASVTVENGKLRVRSAEPLPAEVKAELRAHATRFIQLLSLERPDEIQIAAHAAAQARTGPRLRTGLMPDLGESGPALSDRAGVRPAAHDARSGGRV